MGSKEFTLIQKLIDCATLHNSNSTFSELAFYLLLNYNRLELLTMKIITDDCFVSPSSVRRFCQSIGYNNFSDLAQTKTRIKPNQHNIAFSNQARGRYDRKALHREITDITYSVSRNVSKEVVCRLAREIVHAKNILLFCVRPYSLWCREFQSQLIALGKPLYILEELAPWDTMIDKMNEDICSIIISPAAQILPILTHDIGQLPGYKALVVCDEEAGKQNYCGYFEEYDSILFLKLKTHDYEYLELFGKYAVSFLFEIILGEVIGILQGDDIQ